MNVQKPRSQLDLCFPAQMEDHWRRVRVMTGNIGVFQIRGIFKYVSSIFQMCLLLKICVVPVWSCKFCVSNIVNKLISPSFQPACFWCRELTFFPYFTVKTWHLLQFFNNVQIFSVLWWCNWHTASDPPPQIKKQKRGKMNKI